MSNNGIKTSFWGPHAWAFLFSSIAGSYPIHVDQNNGEHIKIVKSYQNMLNSLQYTLPCLYCRQSFGKYVKELPMTEYLHSRKSMMKWLYLIHDKVNIKLMKQEQEAFEAEKKKLMSRNMKPDQLKTAIKKLRACSFKTKQSPSFDKVIARYEKQRAGCSKKTKNCI